MKKLFAMLLAVVMIFSLATVSFASEDVETPVYEDMETVTVTKTYTATNEGTVSPAETFSFTALTCVSVTDAAKDVTAANAPVPTIGSVDFAAGEASATGEATATKDITITLPEYTSVGIYTYTFSEVVGNTAGVTYHADPITLKVTVIQGEDGKIRVAAVHTESAGEKSDDFENVYSAGSLAVSKTVTGNLGDQTKDFIVEVTFTAPEGLTVKESITYFDGEEKAIAAGWTGTSTVEIALKHGETVTFENIPYGVAYTVVENDYTGDGYKAAKYTVSDNAYVIDSALDTVGITNDKTTNVDTGVVMDSIPYVLILAVAAFGIVAIMSKKRYEV